MHKGHEEDTNPHEGGQAVVGWESEMVKGGIRPVHERRRQDRESVKEGGRGKV